MAMGVEGVQHNLAMRSLYFLVVATAVFLDKGCSFHLAT